VRALLLSTLPREGPSARPRLYAYERHLRDAGIEPEFAPLLSSRAARRFYAAGAPARAGRLARAAAGAVSRLARLLAAGRFDVVVVHRDLLPRGNRLALAALRRSGVPYVYDFDDAIYLSPRDFVEDGETSRALMARGKDPAEVEDLVAGAAVVLAGNETLAGWAREHNPRVRVQPTPVDTDVFRPPTRPREIESSGVVGWVGSPTATYCLMALRAALGRVGHRHRYALRVVGAGERIEVPGVPVRQSPWQLDTEVDDYRSIDVGLYPLPDNEWTRGKCGYKALVYMATGAVPVVSPVGVSEEIVEHGVRGFHASSDDEWAESIHRLLEDRELRTEMAVRGRAFVEERYSVRALHDGFVRAVRDAVGTTT
jgi:glycosyltransferase involved in cell wall biosynthesis